MRCFSGKRQSYGIPLLSSGWGAFNFFIEVDDQFVVRQVNQFENGTVLRYDREHWCDKFGSMFLNRFSWKEKAGRGMHALTQSEFERVWRKALAESIWDQQQSCAMMHERGTWKDRISFGE